MKGPVSSYLRFFVERIGTGDYKHIAVKERTKLIAREWRELGASEKKVNFPQPEIIGLDNILLTHVRSAEVLRRLRTGPGTIPAGVQDGL